MQVIIDDVVSNVSALDDEALLAPGVLQEIVRLVLEAVQEREEYHQRVLAEREVLNGVPEEMDRGWE